MSDYITTARQRQIAFRAMIADIFTKLTSENEKFLALVYKEDRSFTESTELADMLLKQHSIQNCQSDLTLFGENLALAKRNDLQKRVHKYLERYQPPLNAPEYSQPISEMVTSIKLSEAEKEFDHEKQLPVCLGEENCGKKRKFEGPPDDKKFMKQAQEAARNSENQDTKIGAVVVKDGEVVGRGWNRMPLGFDRLPWVRDRDKEPFEAGKHLYVVYGIRAAIFDAYKKKADLSGATLYTTLFPSNVCAQCIREAEIGKVVWCSDKFHKTKVMKASRRILGGIECKQYDEKD